MERKQENPESHSSPQETKPPRSLTQAVGLGTNILGGVALLALGGYWMDQRRGGGQGWTLTGMGLGFVYGIYEVWKVIRLLNVESATGKGHGTGPAGAGPAGTHGNIPGGAGDGAGRHEGKTEP